MRGTAGSVLARLLIGAGVSLCCALPALATPAMWRVTDGDSEIYLFGSVHILPERVDWRTPQFDAALEGADSVYFEIVLDQASQADILAITMREGMLPTGERLVDLLGAANMRRLDAAAAKVAQDPFPYQIYKPWIVALMLAGGTVTTQISGGVEVELAAEIAPERQRGLETPDDQLRLFYDMPIEEQVEMLLSTIESIETDEGGEVDQLIRAWEQGDLDTIGSIVSEDGPDMMGHYNDIVVARNERWVETLTELLARNEEALIVVGAGHMPGPDGVPALLEARGFTVERIDEAAVTPPSASSTSRRSGSTARQQ